MTPLGISNRPGKAEANMQMTFIERKEAGNTKPILHEHFDKMHLSDMHVASDYVQPAIKCSPMEQNTYRMTAKQLHYVNVICITKTHLNVVADMDKVSICQGGLMKSWHNYLLFPYSFISTLNSRSFNLRYCPQDICWLLGIIRHFLK